MDSNYKSTRRRFLKSALAAGVGMTIVPRHVLGGNGFIAYGRVLCNLFAGGIREFKISMAPKGVSWRKRSNVDGTPPQKLQEFEAADGETTSFGRFFGPIKSYLSQIRDIFNDPKVDAVVDDLEICILP